MKHLLLAAGLLAIAALAPAARAGDDDPGPSRFFDTYDKNGDGRVTPEELGVDAEIFRLLDRDQDGAITPSDLGGPADFRPRPGRGGPGAGPGGPGGGPGAGPGGPGGGPDRRGPPRLMEMDADGDGKVTREEFRGPPDAFDRFDANRDGVLDRTECEQAGRGPGGGPGNRFLERLRQLDKDGDGKVSADEYQGRMPFERLDRNGDGYLDAADFAGRRGPDRQRMREALQAMDANGDGKISPDEYTGPIPFERLDRNGDGFLDEQDAPPAGGPPGPDGEGPRRGRGLTPQALQRFDRDGDGKVTREEFPGSDERFHAFDTNGDGVLTEADLPAPPPGGPPGAPPGAPPGPGAETPGPDAVRAAIDRDDEDGDGRVSRDEYRGPAHLFDAMDRNKDGFVDADDLP